MPDASAASAASNGASTSTTRFDNLQVISFTQADTAALSHLANRAMKLQVNIQDGDVMVSVDESIVYITPNTWKGTA
jgi:uncharacterized protein YaeQ